MVSIITPAYNRARYLDETIQSVLKQDYPKVEYIVLDDGSTDNTREVLEKYSGQLIWETHPNMGEHRTVNKGWGMARGEFVNVLSSDDTLLPGAVSIAVDFLQLHPDVLVAFPDWDYVGPDSELIEHVRVPEFGRMLNDDYLHMLKRYESRIGPGAFIRREAFALAGMRDPSLKYVADFEYWLRLGLYGEFARIPKTLATWRVHHGSASVSGAGRDMADGYVRLLDRFYSRPDLPPVVHRLRKEAYSSAHSAAAYGAGSAHWEARRHCLISVLYHPPAFLSNPTALMKGLSLLLPPPLDGLLLRCELWFAKAIAGKVCRTLKRIVNR